MKFTSGYILLSIASVAIAAPSTTQTESSTDLSEMITQFSNMGGEIPDWANNMVSRNVVRGLEKRDCVSECYDEHCTDVPQEYSFGCLDLDLMTPSSYSWAACDCCMGC
ncbi:hypothetical protein FQN54_001949 [Arachnomyces sp. PD_36]|nr:hypothetical protein FQN54_001949 [Arachnomyces sp. PD_36]